MPPAVNATKAYIHLFKRRNLSRLTAARSEQSAATHRPSSTQLKPISIYLKGKFAAPHGHLTTCIAPSLNPDRPAIPQKSSTLSNCKSASHCRSPSTQPKPIFIYLKGKFAAAHSRKVGTVSGDPPPAVNATKAYIHLFKRQICGGSQPQRSEQSAATRHKTCIAPSLNSDRSAILRKSATLSKVGICCAPRALRVGRLSCR